jgi:hypothetical protein
MQVTCIQALYRCKQDKYPYICNCNCTCNYNYNYPINYPLYKYLLNPLKAYILKSFTLIVKQYKQVFYLLKVKI